MNTAQIKKARLKYQMCQISLLGSERWRLSKYLWKLENNLFFRNPSTAIFFLKQKNLVLFR